MKLLQGYGTIRLTFIDRDNRDYVGTFEITPMQSYYVGCLEDDVQVANGKIQVRNLSPGRSTSFKWWIQYILVDFGRAKGDWPAVQLVGIRVGPRAGPRAGCDFLNLTG